MTISELAALVGGQFASETGEPNTIVAGAAIAEAGEGHVTFFAGNKKYLQLLKTCRATAVLVPLDFAEVIPPIAIRVQSPSLAFSMAMERLAPAPIRFAPGVHPTAVIGEGVVFGVDVSIQPHVVIESGAKIGARSVIGAGTYIGHETTVGEDCKIAARVTIGERCVLGNRVTIHSGTVLGADGFGFELQDSRLLKVPQIGIVQIDNDVEIGANVCIDRARFGRTWIQEGTKIDNLVQIAHNVVVGRHCIICGQVGISGSTRIGNYVTLAGQVGIVGHIEIGDKAILAAKSGVSKNVGTAETWYGIPAQPIKEAKEQLAYIARLGKLYERVKKLEKGN